MNSGLPTVRRTLNMLCHCAGLAQKVDNIITEMVTLIHCILLFCKFDTHLKLVKPCWSFVYLFLVTPISIAFTTKQCHAKSIITALQILCFHIQS